MFPEIRRWLSGLGALRLVRLVNKQHLIASDKENRYLRRRFVDAYLELHSAERALDVAKKRREAAVAAFEAWLTICKQAGVRSDAPGQFEVSQHVAS